MLHLMLLYDIKRSFALWPFNIVGFFLCLDILGQKVIILKIENVKKKKKVIDSPID